ncbi:MAG: EamA family transporter, partial [Longimicrobiales bacterium]
MRRTEWLRLVGAFAAIYLIWGATYLAIAVTVETVPPVFMVAMRGAVAGGALYVIGRLRGEAPLRLKEISAAVPNAILLFGGGYVLVSWAAQHLATGVAALLNATIPAFVVLIEWWTGRRTRPRGWVVGGLLSGLSGIALLVMGRIGCNEGVALIPAGVMLAASFFWALGSVRAGKENAGTPLRQAAVQLLTSALLLLPVSAL